MVRKKPEERIAEIIAVSRKLFLEHGFKDVTVADILRAADLSKGGFYHYFESKDDLLRAIILQEFSDFDDHVQQSLGGEGPVRALLSIFDYGSVYHQGEVGILKSLSTFQAYQLYLDVIEQVFAATIKPTLVEIIVKGIQSGDFSDVDASAIAEIFVAVNDHGNRNIILNRWQHDDIQAYNATALHLLGVYLGITEQIAPLIEQLRQNTPITNPLETRDATD